MADLSVIFNSFYFLTILIISGTYGLNIRLYRNQNFTGLFWYNNSTGECYDIPNDKHVEARSIKTDTCFIVYEDSNCNSRWSMKFMPGDINLSKNEITYIFSFEICSEEEGGNQLNVDITKHYEYRFVTAPDILHSYKNVCSCVNVPKNVQNLEKWSIDNHHNALLAYYESDCSENRWNAKYITAGHNTDSREMQIHNKTDNATNKRYIIQSFGPDPNSPYFQTSCHSSNVTTSNWKSEDSQKDVHFEGATDKLVDADSDVKEQIQVLIKKVGELKTQSDISTQNQDNLQNDTETSLNQNNANLTKLAEQITKFQRNVESSLRVLNRTCTKCQCG